LKSSAGTHIRNGFAYGMRRCMGTFSKDILLNDEGFWNPLESLLKSILPISEKQQASESLQASVVYVFEQWF
jgi:hypothetical protein